MKYRDIIGYSKKQPKKKVVPEQPKPSVSELLKEEFGDTINEGPAYEYANAFSKFEKAYMKLQKATDELGSFVTKKTGEKVDQKIIEKQWKKQVTPFYKLMKSWIRGKM